MKHSLIFLLFLLLPGWFFAQNSIVLNARLVDSSKTIQINQEIAFVNTSDQELNSIFLNDWINAFDNKSTALAKRFAEDYIRRFHFAKEEERGHTTILSIEDNSNNDLAWDRPGEIADLVRIKLNTPLQPGETFTFQLNYKVKIPDSKFTRYGIDEEGNYKLRYWYLTPAPLKENWVLYSHQDLNLQYVQPYNIDLSLEIPTEFYATSALDLVRTQTMSGFKKLTFKGEDQVSSKMYLSKTFIFESINTGTQQVITNIEDDDIQYAIKNSTLQRVVTYLQARLGDYPHQVIFVTQEDYLTNPVYGLNQLPSFIRPFPDGFQYDIKLFKTISENYLKNTIIVNPRSEKWVIDAIMISLMIDYVDTYYPKMKLAGNLSKVFGLKWFHAADLEFNDQYQFFYMNMVRLNLDQSLKTSQDSLVGFNKIIANSYKAGVGMKYLEDYLGSNSVRKSISEFYKEYRLKPVSEQDFQNILQKNADKDISWFFNEYVGTNKKIDFKIKEVEKRKDSLKVTVRNKRNNNMPVSLYGIKDGEVVYKTWLDKVKDTKSIVIPKLDIERLALNYEQKIPELNQRNNYKRVSTLFNKPVQFRLFQDVEDPKYNQIFLMPEVDYNLYDGLSIGPKVYNKTVLSKTFNFTLSPKYGFGSQTLVGSAGVSNTHQFENQKLHAIRYGIGGTRFSYGFGLFYKKYTPYLTFAFRDSYLRSNERQQIVIRNINVQRDLDPLNPVDSPNYNVLDVNYRYSNPNFINYFSGAFDYQLSDKFSKISLSLEYRKLFKNNRQVNLRMYAGTFLYNDSNNDDYFSFALDRPTDYLFDYNYYGRSQGSGLFSQQLIVAEGGFKSQLEPEFANQWITTLNGSTNIWNWIYAYGDVGLIKNRFDNPKFVYDSGVRVSLVADYFELFFPVYSNLGWEIAQPNYDQKIRFIVSLSLNTIIRLFTRRWY